MSECWLLLCVVVLLGSHLILPYISLTSSAKTNQTDLISAFPKLYTDLTTTKPEKLLDLSTQAFNFISENRWKYCQLPMDLLDPTRVIVQEKWGELVKVIGLLLPKLAAGWERQRGDEYGFGSNPDPLQ